MTDNPELSGQRKGTQAMSNNDQHEEFYDRSDERKKIPDQISAHRGQRQIIMLVGTTGIGKTSLAEKLLRDELANYKSVTVPMGKSSVSTIENLSYFNALYRRLNDLAKERKDFHIKTAGQRGRRSLIGWIRFAWGMVKGYFNMAPETRIYEPVEELGVSNKKQYILSVLKSGPFIVNVQNIHNIDTQSAELFQSISQNVPDLIWLLEYTTPEKECDDQFYTFCNEWRCVANPSIYIIKKLDFDLAFNLAPPEVQSPQQRKILEARYEKARGNLLTIMVVPKNLDEDGDYIQTKLVSLSKDEKYVVYILFLNGTPMSEFILYSILTKADDSSGKISFSISGAMALLDKLETERIIKKRDETYSIRHDTLITVLSQMPADPPRFLAFKALESHYQEIVEQGVGNQEDYISHLFTLYVGFHDERLIDILPRLWNLISAAKYPKDIVQKIEEYKRHMLDGSGTDPHILYPVARFLTELCIRLQYPKEAQENLDLIRAIKPSQYLIGLQGAIYALRSTRENWDKLNSLIAKTEEGSRLRLSLCLCRLRIMMRSCGSNKPKAYAEELLACPAYKDYPEYGFLLHNYAEFSETPAEALDYYRQAINVFRKYNMVNMQAEVNISMSMGYSYAGQLKNARKAIQKAEKLSPKRIPETVLLNNSAVIEILDGKVSPSVLSKLADAALMNINPYELLIVKSNWLTGLTLSNCMDQAADLATEIENSDYEVYQYEDFLHIIYQNLYFYYTEAGNKEKANYYQKKLTILSEKDGINEGTRTLIRLMLQKRQESKNFYSQFPFRVDFLGFWGLDISPDLENFQ